MMRCLKGIEVYVWGDGSGEVYLLPVIVSARPSDSGRSGYTFYPCQCESQLTNVDI